MKEIILPGKIVALVDDEDFEWLNQWKWKAHKKHYATYAYRHMLNGSGKLISVFMHRQIMDTTDPKIFVDHKDHNGLNNQKYNLRLATPSQNSSNRRPIKNSSSKYLGVQWFKPTMVWAARIKKYGVVKTIGYFKYEANAALAYNEAAKILHGEFANLNVVHPLLIKEEPTNRRVSSVKNSTSKYVGVCWKKKANKWEANIRKDGVGRYLGSFISEEAAALAYNNASIELFGEHATLNNL